MSVEGLRERWLATARVVVDRLSLSAEQQLEHLGLMGVEGSIDELGLEFDDVWAPLGPLLDHGDAAIRSSLEALDRALENPSLQWDERALRESVEWARIREMAREALVAFGERGRT